MPLNGEYPATFLRGIPHDGNQYFDNRGNATGYIFRPHSNQQPANGFYEQSINWEDNDTVVRFTLSERKSDNTLRYKGGAARVLREEIDRIGQEVPFIGVVAYNRDPIEANSAKGIEENPYHGNLLLHEGRVNSAMRKAVFARLKLTIKEVIPPWSDGQIAC